MSSFETSTSFPAGMATRRPPPNPGMMSGIPAGMTASAATRMMMATTSVLPPPSITTTHPSASNSPSIGEASAVKGSGSDAESSSPAAGVVEGPHIFLQPTKCIHDNHDFEAFVRSHAYTEILEFVKACAEAVVDKPNSFDAPEVSDELNTYEGEVDLTMSRKYRRHHHAKRIIQRFVDFMNELYEQVNEIPPLQQPMRFGNKAFRLWHTRLIEKSPTFLKELLSFHIQELAAMRLADEQQQQQRQQLDQQHDEKETGDLPQEQEQSMLKDEILTTENLDLAVAELAPYLFDMFGNATRIDYGTGHELNFAIFFLLLTKLRILEHSSEDLVYVVTRAFVAYIRTMRKLQHDYMLEPAGSHGVWGLDDYHCLLFLWGAAQLSKQSDNDFALPPSCIHDDSCLSEYQSDYLYLEGIAFIKKIKHGAPFAETSPMLNDISNINHWGKVCSGLMKLFQGEVLNKFPVIQHILFGSLLPFTK